MYKKILLGLSAVLLTTALTGCSQVHFGRDAVTIGTKQKVKPRVKHKKVKVAKKDKVTTSSKKAVKKSTKNKDNKKEKPKSKKKVKLNWTAAKTRKLQVTVNKWSQSTGQNYVFYDGIHAIKTKKGATYPQVFNQATFALNKKPIKIGWSPLGKNKYQYNVVAIANDNFKSWHNTYLFCLKNNKPVILLDQSKKGAAVIVKTVKNANLIKGFKEAYRK